MDKILPSGLRIIDLQAGSGDEVVFGNIVEVHYRGALPNGDVFDDSYNRGSTFSFQVGAGNVIKGWDEGLQGMQIGGKRQLIIPPELGYGSRGAGPGIPPNSTLVFEVELIDIDSIQTSFANLSSLDQIGMSIGRLYTAAFGRVPDEAGYNYWRNLVNDPLINYRDIAESFVDSAEFQSIAAPDTSSDIYTTALYMNVLGRTPDSAGLSFWTSKLNEGLQDRADVLISFANSAENVALFNTLL
tara:strand:+ start:166 stop:894 length:729 start_codon:yes stop_codon:yes gene_type:complete